MRCDNQKVLAVSYMLTESLNRKELLKAIIVPVGFTSPRAIWP